MTKERFNSVSTFLKEDVVSYKTTTCSAAVMNLITMISPATGEPLTLNMNTRNVTKATLETPKLDQDSNLLTPGYDRELKEDLDDSIGSHETTSLQYVPVLRVPFKEEKKNDIPKPDENTAISKLIHGTPNCWRTVKRL